MLVFQIQSTKIRIFSHINKCKYFGGGKLVKCPTLAGFQCLWLKSFDESSSESIVNSKKCRTFAAKVLEKVLSCLLNIGVYWKNGNQTLGLAKSTNRRPKTDHEKAPNSGNFHENFRKELRKLLVEKMGRCSDLLGFH